MIIYSKVFLNFWHFWRMRLSVEQLKIYGHLENMWLVSYTDKNLRTCSSSHKWSHLAYSILAYPWKNSYTFPKKPTFEFVWKITITRLTKFLMLFLKKFFFFFFFFEWMSNLKPSFNVYNKYLFVSYLIISFSIFI